MSRIYFHSEHATAYLRGSERAYAGMMCRDLFASSLMLDGYVPERELQGYLSLIGQQHYLRGVRPLTAKAVRMALEEENFYASLNSALVMGSDAVKLLARLHGQCEIHAYVEGPNRSWLADIIARGRESRVLRADQEWESVASMLADSSREPVVTSFSICSGFPNSTVAGWTGTEDEWYDLAENDRWRLALAGLRTEYGLELSPETWSTMYFGDGTNGFDLRARAMAAVPVST